MDERRHAILHGRLGPQLFRFGLPLAIAMGLMATFNLIDLLIIGRLPNGDIAVGALAICDMIAVIGTILTQGISNASVAVISRYFGKGDRSGLNHATWNSLAIIVGLSLVFGLVGYFGAELLIGEMVGAPGGVRDVAVDYLQILVGHSWTIFFMLHLTAVMRALGSAKWPTIILIFANVLNIFLDVLMVYGPGPAPPMFSWGTGIAQTLGIPHMGVAGAAWATVIARGLAVVICAIVLLRFKQGPRWIWGEVRPKRSEIMRIVRIGAPSSAQFVVRIIAVLVTLSIISRVFTTESDATVLAAFGICVRLDMLALFMAMGWASAASTFVGANLGGLKPNRAVRAGWYTSAYTAVAMLALLAFYLTFTREIIYFFVPQLEVAEVGRNYLQIVGWSYPLIGVAVVLSHALQGATDTVSSFLIDAFVIGIIQIPAMILFVTVGDASETALWYAMAGANVLSALLYVWWYRLGKWTRLEIGRFDS